MTWSSCPWQMIYAPLRESGEADATAAPLARLGIHNWQGLAVAGSRRRPVLNLAEMLDRGSTLVAQMVEQDVAQLASGAPAQRIEDRLMLAHRLSPALPLARKIGGIAHPADPPGKIGVSR